MINLYKGVSPDLISFCAFSSISANQMSFNKCLKALDFLSLNSTRAPAENRIGPKRASEKEEN